MAAKCRRWETAIIPIAMETCGAGIPKPCSMWNEVWKALETWLLIHWLLVLMLNFVIFKCIIVITFMSISSAMAFKQRPQNTNVFNIGSGDWLVPSDNKLMVYLELMIPLELCCHIVSLGCNDLTCWGLNNMVYNFFLMKDVIFWFNFHWSLFPGGKLIDVSTGSWRHQAIIWNDADADHPCTHISLVFKLLWYFTKKVTCNYCFRRKHTCNFEVSHLSVIAKRCKVLEHPQPQWWPHLGPIYWWLSARLQ